MPIHARRKNIVVLAMLALCAAIAAIGIAMLVREGESMPMKAEEAVADGSGFDLVRDGEPRSVIVRQLPGRGIPWNEAIDELQNAVRRATGATLPIVDLEDVPGIPEDVLRIGIGPGPYVESLDFQADQLEEEAYRIVTVGNSLLFLGNGADAIIWAVGEFLDRQMGVRRLWPGELGTYVPRRDSIPAPDIDLVARPPLEQRKLRVHSSAPEEGMAWLRWHQMGSRSGYTFGHAFIGWWDKYAADHPEYFAFPPAGEVQRNPGGVKLDIGNPEVDEIIIREWQEAGMPDNWNISPNDGTGFCVSDACLEMDAPADYSGDKLAVWRGQKNLTNRYVRFWNRLLEKMRAIHPQVTLSAYAYSSYREPPSDITLQEGMVLGIVHSYWAYDAWQAWHDAGVKMVLRPNWWHSGAVAPHLPLHTQGEFVRFAASHGMLGIDFDSLYGNWGTQGPLYYMVARLAARPDLTVDEVIAEYTSAFGQAAPVVADYIQYWERFTEEAAYPVAAGGVVTQREPGKYEQLVKAHGLGLHPIPGSYAIIPYLYSDDVLQPAFDLLDRAERLAEGDDEATARVAFLRDGLQHLAMTREVLSYGYLGTRPADATVERFERLVQELSAFRQEISQRHVVWASSLSRLEERRGIPTAPSRSTGWEDSADPSSTETNRDREFEGL